MVDGNSCISFFGEVNCNVYLVCNFQVALIRLTSLKLQSRAGLNVFTSQIIRQELREKFIVAGWLGRIV